MKISKEERIPPWLNSNVQGRKKEWHIIDLEHNYNNNVGENLTEVSEKMERKETHEEVEYFEDAVAEVVKEISELIISKQKDYGHNNILDFGETGVLVRLNDKMARLKNLYKKGRLPQNEPIEDSWRDIAGYAIIALMLRKDTFKFQLKSEGA